MLCAVLCLLFAGLSQQQPQQEPIASTNKKPHILYIVIDDMGWGDIGFTGSRDIVSPNIDKLANEGLILDRHYTSWMCTPTRGAIMTGRYPISLGIQDDVFKSKTMECLDENHLLPEIVRSNGYKTHMIGKWHLGYAQWECLPCVRGFDTYLGYVNGYTDYIDHKVGQYVDFIACQENKGQNGVEFSTLDEYDGVYSGDVYQAHAKKIIENHNVEEPLFLYFASQTPHFPFYAPERYYTTCKGVGPDFSKTADPRCVMQAMVNVADETLANLKTALEQKGMWDDTIVVFHTDNGAPDHDGFTSNWPLKGWKTYLWDGGVRTPGFVYSKNYQTHKGITDSYVHVSDWYKTIIELTGGWENWRQQGKEMPEDLDSIDQSHFLLHGDGKGPRNELLVQIDPVGLKSAYIKGPWKLLTGEIDSEPACQADEKYYYDIRGIGLPLIQLYNIFEDPSETTDVARSNPDIVEDLLERIIWYLPRQAELKCQLPTSDWANPSSSVPYYIPWYPMNSPDFSKSEGQKFTESENRLWSDLDTCSISGTFADDRERTVAPTTEAPTTVAPTTVAPTTVAPTTVAPTTVASTTVAPTTVAPTTVAPTTVAPTTVAPTTEALTTVAPTTVAPTSVAPTTEPTTSLIQALEQATESRSESSVSDRQAETSVEQIKEETTESATEFYTAMVTAATKATYEITEETTVSDTIEAITTVAPTTEATTSLIQALEQATESGSESSASDRQAETSVEQIKEETTESATEFYTAMVTAATKATYEITEETIVSDTVEAITTVAPTTEATTSLIQALEQATESASESSASDRQAETSVEQIKGETTESVTEFYSAMVTAATKATYEITEETIVSDTVEAITTVAPTTEATTSLIQALEQATESASESSASDRQAETSVEQIKGETTESVTEFYSAMGTAATKATYEITGEPTESAN